MPATDWAADYKKYRMEAEGLSGAHAGNFNPKPFGVILAKLEKHHTDSISTLVETVRFLLGELTSLKSQVAALDSVVDAVTPAPFATILSPAPRHIPAPPAAAAKLSPPPPPPPPPAVPVAPLWATVARRVRRGKAVHTAAGLVESFHLNRPPAENYAQFMARRNAGASAPPQQQAPPRNNPLTGPPASRRQINTTPPLRPRRLLIKRDGSNLSKTPVQLRDDLNKALNFTAILSVQIARSSAGGDTGNVSLTLMENLLASKLYAKIGEHLAIIPGALSLHLDSPIVQMVVHGVPTSLPLESLQHELTTYNPGLVMASAPRWLTKPEQRKEKRASSVVIALSGNKAQEVASRPRLFAFSATLRTERKLRFGPTTQCAKCQKFGHHTNKCKNNPACRWCSPPTSRVHTPAPPLPALQTAAHALTL